MSPGDVTTDQILSAMQHVPADRWGEVLHVIESLRSPVPSSGPSPAPVRVGTDLQGSVLIGIWANRSDLGNGHEFARDLRRRAEQRDR
jgi:hypothetical protein